jgi:hypothetical protein
MKIVDFTCDWAGAGGLQTPAQVFDSIWNGAKFWTAQPAGLGGGVGFKGEGDPIEDARKDNFNAGVVAVGAGTAPKFYTYEHLAAPKDVNNLLDVNSDTCGPWAGFLMAFAGSHGHPVKRLSLELRARVERGGVLNRFVNLGDLAATGGFLVGDVVFIKLNTGLIVKQAVNGQANPANLPGGGVNTHLSRKFQNHCVTFVDTNDNDDLDPGERIYDPSYEHAGGLSHATIIAWEDASITDLVYDRKITVTAVDGVGKITASTPLTAIAPASYANNAANQELEGAPSAE